MSVCGVGRSAQRTFVTTCFLSNQEKPFGRSPSYVRVLQVCSCGPKVVKNMANLVSLLSLR